MRILHVINVRWFNATAWYGMYLARLLQDAGHEVLVLGLHGTLSAQKGEEMGLHMQYLPLNTQTPWGIAALTLELKNILKQFQPDIVNCHRGESFVLWGLLRKAGYPFRLVRTRGDQRLPKPNFINRWLHTRVADAVITTNAAMTRHFQTKFRISHQKLHEIPGGVNTQVFFPDSSARKRLRQEFGYEDMHQVVGLLGRFDRVKGQKELIDAVAHLYHTGSRQIRLLLLGFGSATPEDTVRAWIQEAGIAEITRITGKRADIAACINALDLGIVASLWSETIARAALEIMACGVPLLGTRVGVLPDLLAEKALISPGEPEELFTRIQKAFTDQNFYQSLATEQQIRMRTLRQEDFLQSSCAVYESLL